MNKVLLSMRFFYSLQTDSALNRETGCTGLKCADFELSPARAKRVANPVCLKANPRRAMSSRRIHLYRVDPAHSPGQANRKDIGRAVDGSVGRGLHAERGTRPYGLTPQQAAVEIGAPRCSGAQVPDIRIGGCRRDDCAVRDDGLNLG